MHILFIFRGQPPWSLERVVTWGPSEKNLGGTRWRIDFIRVRSCAQLAFKRDREKKNKIKYLPPTRAREQHTPLKCIRILYIFFPLSLSLWWLPSFFYSLLSTITPRCVGYVLHIHRRRCFSISFLWEEKKWATCLWGPFARIVKKKVGNIHNTCKGLYSDRFIINGTTHEMSISWPNRKKKQRTENQALNTLSASTCAWIFNLKKWYNLYKTNKTKERNENEHKLKQKQTNKQKQPTRV